MVMNHDVFISYSSKDRLLALDICNEFEEKGIRCWIAERDIPPGGDYSTFIPPAIKAATVVVLLCTTNSYESINVKSEIRIAFDNKLTIIPFKVTSNPIPESWEYYLAFAQWLDVSKLSWNVQLTELINSDRRHSQAVLPDQDR